MKVSRKALIMLVTAPLLWSSLATADVLLIDEVRQAQSMQLPENGISKADVEAMFGQPDNRRAPVGDPPITRWDYERYSVYFEYDLVLFSVLAPGEPIEDA